VILLIVKKGMSFIRYYTPIENKTVKQKSNQLLISHKQFFEKQYNISLQTLIATLVSLWDSFKALLKTLRSSSSDKVAPGSFC